MSIKRKVLEKQAKAMGYDVKNPNSIIEKTLNDIVSTSQSFMSKKQIILLLQEQIHKLEVE